MSRAVPAFFSLVGVFMFLGFGAALAWRVHDAMQAPAAPPHVTPDQLLGLARTGEPWIQVDAAESCEYGVIPSGASRASYRVLVANGAVRGLTEASDARGCADAPHAIRGTIRSRVLSDLELPADAAEFFAANIGPEIVVMWVDDDPHLGFGEAAMWGAMAALGLCIAWFYAAALFARAAKVRLPPRSDRPALPLLPARPLQLARAYRASPWLGVVFFAVVTLMFAGITIGQLPPPGTSLDLETMGLMAFGGVMTLVLGALMLVVLRGAIRPRPTVQSPREAWAPVVRHEAMLAKGVDVGNRTLVYRDPFTREGEPERIVEVVIGANEGMPWIVDQHVLVLKAEGDAALYVMREDGGPFDLDDAELAPFARGSI